MIKPNTKIRITWEMRNIETDYEFVGSINEMIVNTVAEAAKWISDELPKRGNEKIEVDQVVLDEVGDFADDEGIPMDAKRIGTYDPHFDEWNWVEF